MSLCEVFTKFTCAGSVDKQILLLIVCCLDCKVRSYCLVYSFSNMRKHNGGMEVRV